VARQDVNQALLQTSFLYGANSAYIEALQAQYEKDPQSVEPGWREFFAALGDDPASVAKTARGASWSKPNWPAKPQGDLISALIAVEEAGEQLTEDELITTAALLFGAGFETTTNLIGNGLLALLDHPDQLQRLRTDRSLMKTAVEELLRWDSPVQIDGRALFEAVELHGVRVEAGEQFATLLGAANRDPRMFDEPDRFDVGRVGPAPMSFGAGIHFCLGAALARAEGDVVFDRLLDRFSNIEPAWGDTRPAYRDTIVLHGLESLPVRVS